MDDDVTPLDLCATRLAARQQQLLTIDQLRRLGFSRDMVRHRLRTHRFERMRRGVVGIAGAPPSFERMVLAAVLAAGETAAASHLTAAALWKLVAPEGDSIEVTTVLERQPRQPGVRGHRSGLLSDLDRTTLHAVPVHSVERTAADLSGRLTDAALAALVDDALRRRLTTMTRLWRVHERLPLAPGRNPARLERVLATRLPDVAALESPLEERVYETIRAGGLPLPVPQHWVTLAGGERRRLDFAYPDLMVAIEVDGFDPHSTRTAFDDDRVRNNGLTLAGYLVLHVTSAMTDEQIVDAVRSALHVRAETGAMATLSAQTGGGGT
jgi:hypothetical protein